MGLFSYDLVTAFSSTNISPWKSHHEQFFPLKSLIGRDIIKYISLKLFQATLSGSLTVLRLTLLS